MFKDTFDRLKYCEKNDFSKTKLWGFEYFILIRENRLCTAEYLVYQQYSRYFVLQPINRAGLKRPLAKFSEI